MVETGERIMWSEIKNYKESAFKRYTGVSIAVFNEMKKVLEKREADKKKRGRLPKFCIEDEILITLEYLREYRTYFHIGVSWGTDESTISRIVRRVEDALIKDERFHILGKKALLDKEKEYDVVIVDATEVEIERPKKSNNAHTVEKRNATRIKHN